MSVKHEVFAYHKKLMDDRVGKYFWIIIKIILDMIRLKFSCKQVPIQDFWVIKMLIIWRTGFGLNQAKPIKKDVEV